LLGGVRIGDSLARTVRASLVPRRRAAWNRTGGSAMSAVCHARCYRVRQEWRARAVMLELAE